MELRKANKEEEILDGPGVRVVKHPRGRHNGEGFRASGSMARFSWEI